MRRRNIKNADEKIQVFDEVLITNPEDYYGKIASIFPKQQKIYLEIGMGKGNFIIEQARTHPDINFIGLEKYASVILQALVKANELKLPNLRLINGDATNLEKYFKKDEIDMIYLNFSDPWPKARHAKRRLTSPTFLKIYENITKSPTTIEFKTDNRGLFEYSVLTFNELKYKFLDLSFNLHEHAKENNLTVITTEYEDRFSQMGNPIYFIKVEK